MLILLDTALSLMNINEPVYPLDIVRHMRDQRPYMVQNVVRESLIFQISDSMIQRILFFSVHSSSNTSLSVSAYLKRMRNSRKSIRLNKIWNKNDKIEKKMNPGMGLPLTHNACM